LRIPETPSATAAIPTADPDALFEADLAAMPEAERERLRAEATARVHAPLLRGKAGGELFIRCEMMAVLGERSPGRYDRPPARDEARDKASPRKVYRHPEAAAVLTIVAGDEAAIGLLARALAKRFRQDWSRRGYAHILRGTAAGKRDRVEVADALEQALNFQANPDALPGWFRQPGKGGAGGLFTCVVTYDLDGPPLNEKKTRTGRVPIDPVRAATTANPSKPSPGA
jgi:hypothetical protein